MKAFAPRSTGKAPEEIILTGKLVPFMADEQPLFLNMPLSPHDYIACFATENALRSFMARAKVAFDKIKHIDDGTEFLVSIPHEVVVIVDPWWTEQGTVRFHQLFRD